VGAPDLLAKHVFSEELPLLFGDTLAFHPGMDLGFAELRLDGLLALHNPLHLPSLPAPWCHLSRGFVVVEMKMPGDHTGEPALARAFLRSQALRVVLLERTPSVTDPVVLWVVAPHVPAWLPRAHQLTPCGPGCYRIEAGAAAVFWMAANELPLHEALLPLLVARSGKKLVELVRWAMSRRPAAWVARLLEWGSMSPELVKEMEAELRAYNLKAETPEEKEAAERAARLMLLMAPQVGDELVARGLRDGEAKGLREGEAKGLREGEAKGLREGLRAAVADLCELLGVSLTAARQADLAALDLAGLEALRQHLKAHKAWPAGA